MAKLDIEKTIVINIESIGGSIEDAYKVSEFITELSKNNRIQININSIGGTMGKIKDNGQH